MSTALPAVNSGAAPATVSKSPPLTMPLRPGAGRRADRHRPMPLASPETGLRRWFAYSGPPRAQGVAAGNGRACRSLFRRTADQPSQAPCRQSRVSVRSVVMPRKLFLSFSILVVAVAQAQEAQLQPTIEVTATRVAETVDASLADVSIVTRPDIDASHAPDLIELLRLQAG